MNKDSIYSIFDIETDGLLDEVTKIHCLSYQDYQNGLLSEKVSLTDYNDIIDYFDRDIVLVGHSIIRYDIPVIEKLLDIKVNNSIVDTLGISWYLYPYRKKHGLEVWGEDVGVEKPKIEDWKNLTIEEYIFRCESDVEINLRIFRLMFSYLNGIYPDFDNMVRMIGYINFKLDCIKDQEEVGIKLDLSLVNTHLETLEELFNEKFKILSMIMPTELGKVIKTKPTNLYKKDGELTIYGEKWFIYLQENNLPLDTEVVREIPNPGSDTQLKNWLMGLGWQPITFKVSKQTGKNIPQVSLPFGAGICQSVKALYEVEPNLVELENYFKLKHRIGVFKSFLKNEKDGYVRATAHGFTNTMRLTHSEPVVNLPKPGVFYGKEIREVLTAPEGYIMCGSDVSSLEDNTKQHYIYFFDPDYVNDMRVPGFDPHIDIGVLAGLITEEEAEFFKKVDSMSDEEKKELSSEDKDKFSRIKKTRGVAKTANFAATYGAGGPKIANTAKISLSEGEKLHQIYWKRNSAVKKTANTCIVKIVDNQKWLYNPVSGFWMFLKADKDRFSTLNQSSGVYVFDSWLRKVRQKLNPEIKVILQYHDELLLVCKPDRKEFVEHSLKSAMEDTNQEVNLNVDIKVSVDWGVNYSEVH